MEAVLKSEDEERAFKKQIFIIKDREKVIVFLYINSRKIEFNGTMVSSRVTKRSVNSFRRNASE